MKAESFQIPDEVDTRLREWGDYFRDRRRLARCGSAEGRFKPHSDDYAIEGWGEPGAVPQMPPRARDWVLRAIETNDAIMKLQLVQRWCVSYAFAYPNLPRFVVLRALKKFTQRRLSWQQYMDQVDIGRLRVWAHLMRRAA
jgi:hypothetical protein